MALPAYDRAMISEPQDAPSISGPPSFTAMDISGHQIDIITSGSERLHKLLTLLNGAQRSIDLIMYIFANDEAGQQVQAALMAAAARGVRLRIILDRFGSSTLSASFYEPLRAAGASLCFFSKRWRSSYLIRNHQKLILIDNEIVMTGGFNIAHSYLNDHSADRWLDLGVVVTGPSVIRVRKWCEQLYAYTSHDDGKILKLRRLIRRWPISRSKVSWLIGGPTERLSPWARALKRDVLQARTIDMAMAYFSPGQGMLRRLGHIARTGSAHFIMAGKSDNAATIGASRLLYGYLLKRGARIAEYSRNPFHMKLIVIDDITYVGSANFDVRSLFLNVEIMLRVVDHDFAANMRRLIHNVTIESDIITPELHRSRAGLLTRLRWLLSFMIVSVMDYTVSRRLNFGLGENPYRDRR